jgi:hypothetical protein
MKYARIENGIVAETGLFDSIENCFHPSLLWVECPDDFTVGDIYDGTFSHPPVVVPGPPTVAEYTAAVQGCLDAAAMARNYDDIVSACSYAAAENMFQAESIAFLQWRAAVWQCCYGVMSSVEQGLRPSPTVSELIAELPTLVLP